MPRILIIGGCGYVGSRLYQHFLSKHYSLDTVDLEWYGNYVNPKNVKKNYSDLSEQDLKKYHTIILLAAHSSVQMCTNKGLDSFKNNVDNFVHLLEKITFQKFIYASSSSIYGNTSSTLANELYDRYTPTNYYDVTKKVIDYYAQLSNVCYFGLRFGTVNGGSPNLRLDLMINKMYEDARKKGRIIVYNREAHRPILGINDLCRAIEAIIEKSGKKGIYNLASVNASIADISKKVSKKLGNVPVEYRGETRAYNFSISTEKFQKEFNFTFLDSIESIVDSLNATYKTAHKEIRG